MLYIRMNFRGWPYILSRFNHNSINVQSWLYRVSTADQLQLNYGFTTAPLWANLGSTATLPMVSDGSIATTCFAGSKSNVVVLFMKHNIYRGMIHC
jgi:hypothetical protein